MSWVNSKFILSKKIRKFSREKNFKLSILNATHRIPVLLTVVVPACTVKSVTQVAGPSVTGIEL